VILDEADNIHGNYDRGGASAITELVKESGQPIVLIANDYYDMARGLRNATQEIEFRDVSARSIVPVLRDICRKEGIEFESDALERIAERNRGDLRGAINDLQAATEGARFDRGRGRGHRRPRQGARAVPVPRCGPQRGIGGGGASVGVRRRRDARRPDEVDREQRLGRVRPERGGARVRLPRERRRGLGRVRATQNYSYWRYATDNAAAGVAAARDGTKGGWTRYGRPQFWSPSDATADEVVGQIAAKSGCSVATARREVLPFLEAVTHHCKPRELTVAMAAAYDLDEAGIAFVTGSGESTNKVASIAEDAQALREERMEDHAEGAFAGGRHAADDLGASDGETTNASGTASSSGDDGDADGTTDGDGSDANDGNDDDDDGQAGLSDFV